MERLALAARDDVREPRSTRSAARSAASTSTRTAFGPLAGRLHTVLVEGRARSEYQVPGVGRLAFLRDADDSHLLVGLASLVGKWVRDHLMRRIVRFHRAHVAATLPDASGYHDPVTTRFIERQRLVRKERRVENACFERHRRSTRRGARRQALASSELGAVDPAAAPSRRRRLRRRRRARSRGAAP